MLTFISCRLSSVFKNKSNKFNYFSKRFETNKIKSKCCLLNNFNELDKNTQEQILSAIKIYMFGMPIASIFIFMKTYDLNGSIDDPIIKTLEGGIITKYN